MSKFSKKRGKASPAISTASLPDIIFMLLFFFMMVTVLRDSDLKLQVNTPEATELTKLEEKSLVNYIYIGRPTKQFSAGVRHEPPHSSWGTRSRASTTSRCSWNSTR